MIGEHLGFLLTAIWMLLISVMMIGSPLFGGLIGAVGILAGLLEPAGWKPAGAVNGISYIVWSLWLIVAGIILIAGA